MQSECIIWDKFIKPNGYGQIDRNGYAHRAAYEAAYGPIPEGLEIDHLCCVKSCVNPEHLEAVTHGENNRRAWERRGKPTHCKHGHEFTPENTLINSRGYRGCRRCKNDKRMAAYYASKTPQNIGDLNDGAS